MYVIPKNPNMCIIGSGKRGGDLMNSQSKVLGSILVIIGLLAILSQIFHISIFNINNLWFLFILVPGLCFEFAYFTTKREPGILVPGGILTTIGLLFCFEILTGWRFSAYTWPIYPLAVAIGLFQLYWFGGKEKALLIPVGILSTVAAAGLIGSLLNQIFYWLNHSLLIPIVLIIFGLFIIFRKK